MRHTIRELFVSSPLDLNVISWSQVIQTVRDVKSMWRRGNWWHSESVPSYVFLSCPSPMRWIPATKEWIYQPLKIWEKKPSYKSFGMTSNSNHRDCRAGTHIISTLKESTFPHTLPEKCQIESHSKVGHHNMRAWTQHDRSEKGKCETITQNPKKKNYCTDYRTLVYSLWE